MPIRPEIAALATAHRADPHPAWAALHGGPGAAGLVVAYDAVAEALRDPALAHWQALSDSPFDRATRAWFAAMHPTGGGPLHRGLVGAIGRTLRDRAALDALARELFARLPADEPVDLVSRVARPLVWRAAALTLSVDLEPPPDAPLAPALPALAAARPAPPWDGWLARAAAEGLLGEASALGGPAFAAMLLYALTDNLQNAVGLGLLALLRDRAVAAAWAEGAVPAGALVAELLRYDSPVQAVPLVAVADTTVGGAPVAAGQRLLAAIGAAHRDAGVYPEPDRLWPGRGGPPPLAFGHGPLRCVGAGLATATLEAALRAAAPRLAGWAVDEPGVTWREAPAYLRGPLALPVTARAR